MNYIYKLHHLRLILQTVQNTETVNNAQTITFNATTNQITHTISATDTITTALTPNVTISTTLLLIKQAHIH